MSISSIDAAILAHKAWVVRFQTAIQGTSRESFDLGSARNDGICTLGRWLNSPESQQVLDPEQHRIICELHRNFHEVAGDLAERINRHDALDEIELLFAEFGLLSRRLIDQLRLARRR